MAQTLVIVLEKQNDQPTPSKVLPKSSLSLSCLGELTKSVQGGHAVPSCFLTERSPFTGARPLKAPRQEEPQKVHSDPPSFSLSCQSAANLSQAQTSCAMTCRGAQESQAGRETRLPSLCGPASLSLWTGALGAASQHLSTKEHVTCTWGKPSPWDTPLVEGKEHLQRQSEGGGELPPGA